jgi:iron complex outermembrane receptor protein
MNMSRKFALLAGASFMMMSTGAFAQDAVEEPVAAEEETGGLEEIVVTAQKREENLQNVPVSVTALSAEALANNRIADFLPI